MSTSDKINLAGVIIAGLAAFAAFGMWLWPVAPPTNSGSDLLSTEGSRLQIQTPPTAPQNNESTSEQPEVLSEPQLTITSVMLAAPESTSTLVRQSEEVSTNTPALFDLAPQSPNETATPSLVTTRTTQQIVTTLTPQPARQLVTISAPARLRVRELPEPYAPILGHVTPGDSFVVLDVSGDALWVKIEVPGIAGGGWVVAEYVTLDNAIAIEESTTPTTGTPAPVPSDVRPLATLRVVQTQSSTRVP